MGKNAIISTLPNISQNYLPKVNTSNIFANSLVFDDGNSVLINTTTASAFRLDVNGTARTGALTLTGALSGTSATFSGNVIVGTGTTGTQYFANASAEISYSATTGLWRFNNLAGGSAPTTYYQFAADGTPILSILKSGAATFSSSVTATNATFTNTNAGNTTSALRLSNDSASANSGSRIEFHTTDAVFNAIDGIRSTGSSGGELRFWTMNSSGTLTRRMTITDGGNVGIGTASPLSILHILGQSGTTGLPSLLLYGESPSTGQRYGFNVSADQLDVSALGTNARIAFFTGGNASTAASQERMRITSGGRVGIGTTNPLVSLQIGNNTASYYMNIAGSVTSTYIGSDANGTYIGNDNDNPIRFVPNNTERMRITSGGNVTIGTAGVPSGAAEFNNGSLFTSNNIFVNNSNGTSGYAVRFDGFANNLYILWSNASGVDQGGVGLAYGGTSWSPVSSDARTKKNFETSQGLAEVLQIEPIKYHLLTDDDNATKRLGFKAQNIQPLIPEMVIPTGKKAEDGSDILTITPDYMLPVLVKAIQELKGENDTLKADIESLKALINK